MADRIQVLVVADNLLARAGLAALLDTQDNVEVVGQATGNNLLDMLELTQADVILYDMGWRVTDALQPLAIIARQETPIVVLIADENDAQTVMGGLVPFAWYGLLLNENDPELHIA